MDPFIPMHLPITGLNWEEISLDAGRANRAIARYDGLLQGIPDAGIMLSPLTTQEAVLSSKIEGTQATLGDVLQHDAGQEQPEESRRADIFEIVNYRAALGYAREALQNRPFSLGLLKELHQRLMAGVRGENKNPGAFRTRQNWIGLPNSPIEEAFFVPPPPHLVQGSMDNLIDYYHFEERDPLTRLAVLHAQFEIIHPFDDGNGRLGRMFIPLFLYEKKVLAEPMFYLSGYLEKHRDDYVQHLRGISDTGGWQRWILFFLRAVTEQAQANARTVQDILDLYSGWKKEMLESTRSQYAVPILDYMFAFPVFHPAKLAGRPDMPTRAQLSHLFGTLKSQGIVTVLTPGRGRRPEVLMVPALINLCEGRRVFFDPRQKD